MSATQIIERIQAIEAQTTEKLSELRQKEHAAMEIEERRAVSKQRVESHEFDKSKVV
jgi:hypothetical protein